ncbi:MAG: DMT family transporter, partial [Acidimicrobiia bacterium]|nr:DMT family transporter [Acidimicrobiia bacterium]
MSERVSLTVALSLVAAFLYAVSNVLEQGEAQQMPGEYSLRPSLIVRLAARRRWLIGFVADAGGYVVSAGALAIGAVVFVAPILSLGLLISMLLGALVEHRRVPIGDWISAFLLCGGLVLFLFEVSPTGGGAVAPARRWAFAAPGIVLVILILVVLARRAPNATRSALLGVAAAVAFASGAVLTKAFVHFLGEGPVAWAPHWEPYAMAVAILGGLLLVQSAFQAGSLAASVAGIEATEPLVSVVLGVTLLHERVALDSPTRVASVAVACVAVVWALVSLARSENRE